VSPSGREELARRLNRVFISDAESGFAPPDATLLRFADDILAADFTDPQWGPRKGDGGPAMRLVDDEPTP
jgi:hypothetical protein